MANGSSLANQVNKGIVLIWMSCMMMLGEAYHSQISSRPTLVPILDTIRGLRNSSTSFSAKQISNGSVKTSNVLYTSANQALGRAIGVITTPTIESRVTSSLVKHQGKSSLTDTMVNEPSGSTNLVAQPCLSPSSSVLWTSGRTELKPREAQSLSITCGRSLSALRHIQLIGGDSVLSIWKTPGNCGEDSLESITFRESPVLQRPRLQGIRIQVPYAGSRQSFL